jgi:hypothetical protein
VLAVLNELYWGSQPWIDDTTYRTSTPLTILSTPLHARTHAYTTWWGAARFKYLSMLSNTIVKFLLATATLYVVQITLLKREPSALANFLRGRDASYANADASPSPSPPPALHTHIFQLVLRASAAAV